MKRWLLVLLLLLSPSVLRAQSAEPNVSVRFEVGTDYVKLTDGSQATVVTARLPLTARWSAVYSQYQIPAAKSQFFIVETEFREKLSHIFKTEKTSAGISLDGIQVFARGGFGTRRDDLGNSPSFAYSIHGGGSFKIAQSGAVEVLAEFKVGLVGTSAKLPIRNRFVFGSSPEIAPGIVFRF